MELAANFAFQPLDNDTAAGAPVAAVPDQGLGRSLVSPETGAARLQCHMAPA